MVELMRAAKMISRFRTKLMGTATLPLDTIYAPVAQDLEAVQDLFDQELQCDLPFLADLCAEISRYRGKMLRPALTLLAARACGGIRPAHITLAAVFEMVHMATLVHDDVLDEAELRRVPEWPRRISTMYSMFDQPIPLGDSLSQDNCAFS